MKNHLFIGLGGQGGRSLAELRKVMEQRDNDVANLQKKHGVKWDFLSIDSSSDVWDSGKDWKYFGKDISLQPNQLLSLDLLANVGNLSIRPDVAPWIGGSQSIDTFLDDNREIPGANQIRRLGRLLFANNADQIRQAFRSKMAGITDGGSHQCWIHVFGSLGGGTGSGGILDIVTLLRTEYNLVNAQNGFPIFLHLFITADYVDQKAGYFYQNQFAALRDLNALVSDRFKPNLLGAEHGGALFSGQRAANSIALFSNLNSRKINLTLLNQIRISAESCFERIYSSVVGNLSANTQKAITNEDIYPNFPGEPRVRQERSYCFGSMGMRRWEVPSEKMQEYIALDLMASSFSQMLYNNWQEQEGYSDNLKEIPQSLKSPHENNLHKIITSSSPSAAKETLTTELRKGLSEIIKGLFNSNKEDQTLDSIASQMQNYFFTSFHGGGVNHHFHGIENHRTLVVNELLNKIDSYLTGLWKDPVEPVGLNQIPYILDSLRQSIAGRLNSINSSDYSEKLKKKKSLRRVEWDKINVLSRVFGKKDTLIRAHAADTENEYVDHLLSSFQQNDIDLQRELLNRLNELSQQYRKAEEVISDLKTRVEQGRDAIWGELQMMQDDGGANLYEFDFPALVRFQADLRKHSSRQSSVSMDLRKIIIPSGYLLSRFHYESLKGNLPSIKEKIDDELQQSSIEQVRAIHQQAVSAGDIPPVLNASLLDRLESRFLGDQQMLTAEAKQFVGLAAACLHLDQGQTPPAVLLGGVDVPSMPRRAMVVGIPRHRFSKNIKEAFIEAIPAGLAYVADVYEHDDPTQLRLLVMDYWMAARFSTSVANLAQRYETAAAQNAQNNLLYFCNIDQEGEKGNRPNLFLPSTIEMKQRLEAELWLGQKLPVPILEVNNGVSLIEVTSEGTLAPQIGNSIAEVIATAAIPLMARIDAQIKGVIANLNTEEKAAVRLNVSSEEQSVRDQFGLASPEFRKWSVLRTQINSLLG